MSATMKDIAVELNLSRTVVSYVLNGRGQEKKIPLKTINRIRETAANMGYTVNAVARSITRNESKTIGLVMSDQYSVGFILRMVNKFCQTALSHGYIASVLTYSDQLGYHDAVRKCLEQRMAGIAVLETNVEECNYLLENVKPFGIPTVFIHSRPKEIDSGVFIYSDDYTGGWMIADHLLKLGHTKIAYVNSVDDHHNTQLRLLGFMDRLAKDDIVIEDEYMWKVYTEDLLLENSAIEMMRHSATRPTAIACISDTAAMEVLRYSYLLGIKIPDEVSITGFADMHFAKKLHVPLTTVRQDFNQIGTQAFKLLENEINLKKNKKTFSKEITYSIPVELIVRESTCINKDLIKNRVAPEGKLPQLSSPMA